MSIALLRYLSEQIWGSSFSAVGRVGKHTVCRQRLPGASCPAPTTSTSVPPTSRAPAQPSPQQLVGWIQSASVGQTECVIDEEPSRTDLESGSQTVPCTDPKDKGGQSVLGAEAASHQHATPFLSRHSPGIVRDIKLFSVPPCRIQGPALSSVSESNVNFEGRRCHVHADRTHSPADVRRKAWREASRWFVFVLNLTAGSSRSRRKLIWE